MCLDPNGLKLNVNPSCLRKSIVIVYGSKYNVLSEVKLNCPIETVMYYNYVKM